jgi:hypothetical protein
MFFFGFGLSEAGTLTPAQPADSQAAVALSRYTGRPAGRAGGNFCTNETSSRLQAGGGGPKRVVKYLTGREETRGYGEVVRPS